MKNYVRLFLLLLFISITVACASTSAGDSDKQSQSNSSLYKEKKQDQKKLLFEDWKYKGFGKPLAIWFEAAYKGSSSGVQKNIPELSGQTIMILSAMGINSDQAEKSLKMKISELSDDFILYDTSWALLGEKAAKKVKSEYPYFAAAVLYKEN